MHYENGYTSGTTAQYIPQMQMPDVKREGGAQTLSMRLSAVEAAVAEVAKLAVEIEARMVGPTPSATVAGGLGSPAHSGGVFGVAAARALESANALEQVRQSLHRVLNEL